MLAANFPGGSARNEIKRRVIALSEEGELRSAATSRVIEAIVEELVAASKSAMQAPEEESEDVSEYSKEVSGSCRKTKKKGREERRGRKFTLDGRC